MEFRNAMETLVTQIREMVVKLINHADFDKTYMGVIVGKTMPKNSLSLYEYDVQINGMIYKISSTNNYSTETTVAVMVIRNDWNNLLILGAR